MLDESFKNSLKRFLKFHFCCDYNMVLLKGKRANRWGTRLALVFSPKDCFRIIGSNFSYRYLQTVLQGIFHYRAWHYASLRKIFPSCLLFHHLVLSICSQ